MQSYLKQTNNANLTPINMYKVALAREYTVENKLQYLDYVYLEIKEN